MKWGRWGQTQWLRQKFSKLDTALGPKITHLSSQVPGMGQGEFVRGGGGGKPRGGFASHPKGVTIFLFASSYRTEVAFNVFYFLSC